MVISFVLSHPPTCTPGTGSHPQLSPTLVVVVVGRQRSPERAAGQVRGHLQESQAVLSQVVQGGQVAQALLPVPQAQQSLGLPVTQVSEYERGTTLDRKSVV